MNSKKLQKGGRDSTNIQAENINIGIAYGDAKKIAEDVFKANFLKLTDMAEKVAYERVSDLIEKFLEELRVRSPDSVRSFQDPDMQYDLFIAQRDYARSGNQSLFEMLIDLLVERAKANESSILQIVLNEAIATVAKLLPIHLDTLSVNYLVNQIKIQGSKEISDFKDYLRLFIPFCEYISTNGSVYQHLEYTGCSVISHDQGIGMMPTPLVGIWKSRYPYLFSRGFSESELLEALPRDYDLSQLPLTKDSTSHKLYFEINKADELRKLNLGLGPNSMEKLVHFYNSILENNENVQKLLLSWFPELELLLSQWHRSLLHRMSLTSVGVAIASANIRRKTGVEFDLSHYFATRNV